MSNVTESNRMFGEEKIGKLLLKFSVPGNNFFNGSRNVQHGGFYVFRAGHRG